MIYNNQNPDLFYSCKGNVSMCYNQITIFEVTLFIYFLMSLKTNILMKAMTLYSRLNCPYLKMRFTCCATVANIQLRHSGSINFATQALLKACSLVYDHYIYNVTISTYQCKAIQEYQSQNSRALTDHGCEK